MRAIVFLLLCASLSGLAQAPAKTLQFDEVGWTLHIPPGTLLREKQVDSLIAVAAQKKKQHGNAPADFEGMLVLFTFVHPPFNTFASAITHFHADVYPSWMTYHDKQIKGILQQLIDMKPSVLVKDTASGTEMIGGLLFQRYYIKTFYPKSGLTMYNYNYARLVHGCDLMIMISYMDEKAGQQYRSILRASTFKE
jgi:hypothetical protein